MDIIGLDLFSGAGFRSILQTLRHQRKTTVLFPVICVHAVTM